MLPVSKMKRKLKTVLKIKWFTLTKYRLQTKNDGNRKDESVKYIDKKLKNVMKNKQGEVFFPAHFNQCSSLNTNLKTEVKNVEV